ncbi:MAG: DUF885 domain-containing protein [Promethearchaeota archaeon]
MSADKQFEKLKSEMYERFYKILPEIASMLGLHDPFDHQLSKGDLTPDFDIEKMLEEAVSRMKETIDFNALNEENKIDWELLESMLEVWKFTLHEQRQNILNPDAFDLIGGSFFLIISRDYAPLEERMKAIISRLKEIPRYLQEFHTRFEKSQPVRLWTEIALESTQQIPGLFQFITMLGKGQISDKLQTELEETVTTLDEPLKEHLAWLQQLQSNTIENWALGKERYERLIQLRKLGMTSEEILQFGLKSLKELKEERRQTAAQIDPDKSVEEVMATIEKETPKTFEEALLATRTAMEEAKQFVLGNDLATIYEEDKLIIEETPAYMAPLIPFAALIPPSRFDESRIGIYVVTRPKDIAHLGKHLNIPSIRNVAVHESFPGHFLQLSASNRGSLIRLLGTMVGNLGIETVEGWAHYCEQMMMEKGFVTGLEAKMIQLTGAIWRAVRIIVDVQLGRKEMTFDEAVNMLVKEASMSKEGATAEVRRYTMSPGYPLSYLLGKHLILQLRDEIMQKMGDKYSNKFFHDTIATNGNLPMVLLRKVFDQKITQHAS